jgi:putative colanic acid biosynthesis acetyltransferase WcaF
MEPVLSAQHSLDAAKFDTFAGAPSFRLRHRLFRALFAVVWLMLARWTPPPLHRWRVALLNVFGAQVHPTARVYSSACIWYPPNLTMAAQAVMGPGVICYNMDRVAIGRRAVVSQRAHLCCGSHLLNDPTFQLVTAPIVVGDKAWVATEAFVGPGVTLGEGAVLGARGVAMRELQPWTVYVGNPVRRLKGRRAF